MQGNIELNVFTDFQCQKMGLISLELGGIEVRVELWPHVGNIDELKISHELHEFNKDTLAVVLEC